MLNNGSESAPCPPHLPTPRKFTRASSGERMQLSPLDWPGICGEASGPWESCLFPSQGLRFFSVYHTYPKLALDSKLRLQEKKKGKNLGAWVSPYLAPHLVSSPFHPSLPNPVPNLDRSCWRQLLFTEDLRCAKPCALGSQS